MKTGSSFFVALIFAITMQWQPDFTTTLKLAREKHELILLNFSGSDWCIPCIRMHKEIFENDEFLKMADTNLVMYNADFPRTKKHALPKAVTQENESLADKYNPDGKFPLTLLLDADGKVLETWDGFPNQSVIAFTQAIKHFCDANSK